jgi:large subunit ribosomal protein L16
MFGLEFFRINQLLKSQQRLGKGKGNPEYWAAVVEPGRILFEADGVPLQVAKEAFELAAQKLPIAVKFVVRRDYAPEVISK